MAKALLIILFLIAVIAVLFLGHQRLAKVEVNEARLIMDNTWAGFKYYFIEESGRVKRIKNEDTVSEGQAYAMLRAVWMNDKETFDKCYIWTENNMSRNLIKADNLLAWHWKDGKVTDWMPASDADIDYVLSLIFAESLWKGLAPADVEDYGTKAKKILADILRFETYSTSTGKLYLSPWILDTASQTDCFPVNPSYYSPAHFRIFYEYTKDSRWLSLIDTTYYLLNSLSNNFENFNGVGLVPDWCSVNKKDEFRSLESKNNGFGYEAIRVPFRVGLDFFWFQAEPAKQFLSDFSAFLNSQMATEGGVFCEYDYTGTTLKRYESPGFYACYYYSLLASGSHYSKDALKKCRSYIRKNDGIWFYQNEREYYLNSLAWLADGLNAGIIRNLYGSKKND